MILIISCHDDISTTQVIEWLDYYGARYKRIDVDKLHPSNYAATLSIDKDLKEIEDINAVWYRRWKPIAEIELAIEEKFSPESKRAILRQINNEISHYFNSLFTTLSRKNIFWLNSHNNQVLNKYNVLRNASNCGLNVPPTIITTNLSALSSFVNECDNEVVMKCISDVSKFVYKSDIYSQYTELINSEKLKDFPTNFFPSLFQKHIKKQFDIRVFFLCNEIYSMAIFSQSAKQTEIDFRRYPKIPNRRVPIDLPKDLNQKLRKLMKEMSLNCGSIDIIKATNGKYYFLEINPVGQFGMVSFPCNFHLEKKIAETLIKMDKRCKKRS